VKKVRRPRKFAVNRYRAIPSIRDRDMILAARNLFASYPVAHLVKKSYVLSRFWAWFSRIELEPEVRIPVPRFLTYRDP
jgi:hypothetical protein